MSGMAIERQWFVNNLILFSILFISYTLKFLRVLPFDAVLWGHFLLILYGIAASKLTVSRAGFFILLLFFFSSLVAASINIEVLGADPSFLKYLFQFLLIGYVSLCVPLKNVKTMANFLMTVVCGLVFSFVFYALISGRHYLGFLGEGFRDQYLVISDLLIVICLLSFQVYSRSLFKIGIFFIAGMALIILGSRSAMVFFFSACLVHLGVELIRKKFMISTKYLMLTFLGSIGAWYHIANNSERFHRLLSLKKLKFDSSYLARIALKENFFQNVDTSVLSFITGGGTLTEGGYIHNFFSAWQFYGVFSFILLVVLAALCLPKVMVCSAKLIGYTPLLLFCLSSLAFSRSAVSTCFPLLFALCLHLIFDKRFTSISKKL